MTASAAQPVAGHATAGMRPPQSLRRACNELIGMVMFGQMLRQSRDSALNSELFHSPGERMFAGQLDDLLIKKATSGGEGPSPFGGLAEGLWRQLNAKLPPMPAPETLDVKG